MTDHGPRAATKWGISPYGAPFPPPSLSSFFTTLSNFVARNIMAFGILEDLKHYPDGNVYVFATLRRVSSCAR